MNIATPSVVFTATSNHKRQTAVQRTSVRLQKHHWTDGRRKPLTKEYRSFAIKLRSPVAQLLPDTKPTDRMHGGDEWTDGRREEEDYVQLKTPFAKNNGSKNVLPFWPTFFLPW